MIMTNQVNDIMIFTYFYCRIVKETTKPVVLLLLLVSSVVRLNSWLGNNNESTERFFSEV